MNFISVLIAISALSSSGSLSSGTPPEGFENDPRLGEETRRVCFARSFRGFSQNTETTGVIEARTDTFYLIETLGVCRNLEHTRRISFDPSSSCIRTNDRFSISDSYFATAGGYGSSDTCHIRAMYEWQPDADEGDINEAADSRR
jgi:hypothetical protein